MRGSLLRSIGVLALFGACGDPPICQSDVFVAIQTSQITVDADAAAMGVQADIRVRTSAPVGEQVTLEVLAGTSVVGTASATIDDKGEAVFQKVTVPTPQTTLRATVDTFCGHGSDEATVDVTAGAGCILQMAPAPSPNPFYAPLAVLAAADDPDPSAPGFQSTISVGTHPGWTVDLFASAGGTEQHVDMRTANAGGVAVFPQTLGEGRIAYRATCSSDGGAAASLTTSVFVDTVPPACAFANPAPGSTITPTFDQNHDLGDGVQLAIVAQITGPDVMGEPVSVKITPAGGNPTIVTGSPVDTTGASTASATLAPAATPANFAFELSGRDHAGNTCMSAQSFDVIYDGCDISVASPAAPVTADADGNPGNGSQVDVALTVAPACVGRTVTSTCGSTNPFGTVPANGQLTLRATVCSTSPCEAQVPCVFHVTTTAGVETTAGTTLQFDDQGPAVSLDIVSPALACNVQITPASDIDANLDGVQVMARVTSAGAASKSLELTNGVGTQTFDASSDVEVTIQPGVNRLVGIGLDALANRGQSANCNVTLADLSVSFSPPVADGTLNRKDGAIAGSSITLPVCGSVNRTGATVTLSVDGGAAQPTTVTGTTWCRTLTLAESPPSHTLVASATAGSSFGTGSVVVRVDLTPPPQGVGFIASPVNRQRIHTAWTSPSDGGAPVASYVLKFATTTITDANFDTTGTVIATGAPKSPGNVETADVFPAHTAVAYWVALATLDAAGNRSVASVVGPITPDFDRTGAIVAPNQTLGALNLGYAIAHGKFNDDDFDDVAVSAPTQLGGAMRAGAVYVYFGGPSGISATPGLIISGVIGNGLFGSGLAAVNWSSATRDDLVVGAPGLDTHGHLFVFHGGASFGTGTRTAASANLHITVNAASPGYFATGSLGRSLVAADVDGDGMLDLAASLPTGGSGSGGVVILYGGTVTGNVALSDVTSSGANGAVAELFKDPGAAPNRQLGFYLHNVGHTEGAGDTTDDLAVVYVDDYATTGDSFFLLRSNGARPSSAGVSARTFTVGRDVRFDLAQTTYAITEWGAQIISIDDQNGDGARDLVVSAHRISSDSGQVFILDGNALGTSGVAATTDAGVVLTTLSGSAKSRFGAFILANDRSNADIDGDGREDLMIGAFVGTGKAFLWYGGTIPTGAAGLASATTSITAPASFLFSRQSPKGFAGQARWVGDVDGDGLDDICWASPFDNNGDGGFEILSD